MAKSKKETSGTAVAVKEDKQTSLVGFGDDLLSMIGADAGLGTEEITAKDQRIPYLSIIQAMSKARKKQEAEYIPGADEGMVYNNLTREVFDGESGVQVVVCHFTKEYSEYEPKTGDEQAKFVKYHGQDQAEAEANCTPGNVIQDAAVYYVLYLNQDGEWVPAVVKMKSSGWKAARLFNSFLRQKTVVVGGKTLPAPSFLFSYTLRTAYEKKDDNSYYVWTTSPAKADDQVDPDLYLRAREFHNLVKGDQAHLRFADEPDTGNGPTVEADAPF